MTWRETHTEKAAFTKVRKAENSYGRRLRQLANHIHQIVTAFVSDTPDYTQLEVLLGRYANTIEPWARAVANRFLAEVARRDEQVWAAQARKISVGLRRDVLEAPVGDMLREFLETQVQLITSLPLEAAQRVHDIAIGNLYNSVRFDELSKHILETGNITKNRANLIARTETARVSSSLTMVRAKHIGSEHFIWRTVRDSDVRHSHQRMDGKVFRWDDPPEVESGKFYLPGMTFNCRCFPEPILSSKYLAQAA